MLRGTSKPGAALTCASLIVLAIAGCNGDSAMPTESHMAGLPISAVAQASNAQALNDLRRLTAPLHDVNTALNANYGLLIAPPRMSDVRLPLYADPAERSID